MRQTSGPTTALLPWAKADCPASGSRAAGNARTLLVGQVQWVPSFGINPATGLKAPRESFIRTKDEQRSDVLFRDFAFIVACHASVISEFLRQVSHETSTLCAVQNRDPTTGSLANQQADRRLLPAMVFDHTSELSPVPIDLTRQRLNRNPYR